MPVNLCAPDGTPTGMILGFTNMLYKVQDETQPDCTVVVFDSGGKTFRHEYFSEYKAGRKTLDENLREAMKIQITFLQEILRLSGHMVLIREGFEADDLAASFTKIAHTEGHEVITLSSDKDWLQFLDTNIKMLRLVGRGISEAKLYTVENFKSEYGFMPSSMSDYLAIAGDTTDNIDGVKGIGEAGAKQLLARYANIEEIFAAIDEIPKRQRDNLNAAGLDKVIEIREKLIKLNDKVFDNEKNLLNECLSLKPNKEQLEELAGRLMLGRVLERLGSNKQLHYSEISMPTTKIIMPEAEILTRDYKSGLKSWPAHFENVSSIWDLKTAYYLLHPDTTVKNFPKILDEINSDKIFADTVGKFNAQLQTHEGLNVLMNNIDLPLIPVLNRMEDRGVRLDNEKFLAIQNELEGKIYGIQLEIERDTGVKININSPQQVSWLLFERLGFEPDTMTKGKKLYSTDAGVLEKLAKKPDGKIPGLILEYRELSKMLSGFVIPLQKAAGREGIIHTTFDPASTGTGRLSSRDPNLQNVPAFGQWAEKIKSGLVPVNPENVFVAADYSQIELRVLAYMSGEERLIDAFKNKRDIHTETASWVFDKTPEFVTPELRRAAKMINFGLLYGMSIFGLADRLDVSRDEAKEIMKRYFDALPGLQKFLDEIVNEAKKRGFSQTVAGRIRPVREIPAKGVALDRALINSPIQGTAADIARRAMINFEAKQTGKLFLQVHDSLVCECSENEADEVANALSEIMIDSGGEIEHLEVQIKRGKDLSHV